MESTIQFVDFELDASAIAPTVYRGAPHQVTSRGVMMGSVVAKELRRFLTKFNTHVKVEKRPFYRIDAYFDQQGITVLEVNAAFVDGWGTALNLSRASGRRIDSELLHSFPREFALQDEAYLPELQVFMEELGLLGESGHIIPLQSVNLNPVYVYGRVHSTPLDQFLPHDGIRLDLKTNLASFSRAWKGETVRVPHHFTVDSCAWEGIPNDAVLKFCDKGGPECRMARSSVIFGKPKGKAPFLRKCYEEGKLLAQELVLPEETHRQEGINSQLIILAIDAEPVVGYVQYGTKLVVTDNSIHAPLHIN